MLLLIFFILVFLYEPVFGILSYILVKRTKTDIGWTGWQHPHSFNMASTIPGLSSLEDASAAFLCMYAIWTSQFPDWAIRITHIHNNDRVASQI